MKAITNKFICQAGIIVLGSFFCLSNPAVAAPTKSGPAKAPARAASEKTNAVLEISTSEFVVPTSPKDGRDPFFPDSTRVYTAGAPKAKSPSGVATLVLNGLSGPPDHRLAMINGRTFAEGEESEITTSTGRFQVRCVSITDDGAVVEVAGERRELKLRQGL